MRYPCLSAARFWDEHGSEVGRWPFVVVELAWQRLHDHGIVERELGLDAYLKAVLQDDENIPAAALSIARGSSGLSPRYESLTEIYLCGEEFLHLAFLGKHLRHGLDAMYAAMGIQSFKALLHLALALRHRLGVPRTTCSVQPCL